MRKLSAILCMIMVMIFAAPTAAYADGFAITSTTPGNGDKGVPLDNMGVKIFFNEEVYNKDNAKANKKACKLLDANGKEVESMTIFNPKDRKVALVLAKYENSKGEKVVIDAESKYTVVIDESFTSADGDKLGKTEKITFKTLNPSDSAMISMAMMVIMFAAMIFASSKAMKKQEEENNKKNHKKEEKFNPYKVAKETGKSVEEVVAAEKKRREKEAAKEAKKAKHHHEEDDYEVEEYLEPGHYRVKAVRTVAQGGSSYVTGRKAEAEAKKAAAAAKKNAKKGKAKGKKKKHK